MNERRIKQWNVPVGDYGQIDNLNYYLAMKRYYPKAKFNNFVGDVADCVRGMPEFVLSRFKRGSNGKVVKRIMKHTGVIRTRCTSPSMYLDEYFQDIFPEKAGRRQYTNELAIEALLRAMMYGVSKNEVPSYLGYLNWLTEVYEKE